MHVPRLGQLEQGKPIIRGMSKHKKLTFIKWMGIKKTPCLNTNLTNMNRDYKDNMHIPVVQKRMPVRMKLLMHYSHLIRSTFIKDVLTL